jgi:hypothetical protein
MSRRKNMNKKNDCKSKVEFVRSVCQGSCKMCVLDPKDVIDLGEDAEDLFCYDSMYVYNPELFMADALPRLLKQDYWPFDTESDPPSWEECNAFAKIFCRKSICNSASVLVGNNVCREIDFCIVSFREYVIACIDTNSEGEEYSPEDIRFITGKEDKPWDTFCNMVDGVMSVAERVILGPQPENQQAKMTKKQRKAAKKKKQKAMRVQQHSKIHRSDPDPTPCFFSNLNTEQLKALDDMLLDEDNISKQDTTEKSAGAP